MPQSMKVKEDQKEGTRGVLLGEETQGYSIFFHCLNLRISQLFNKSEHSHNYLSFF